MLNTPVLFLVFNRPDATLRVFEQIRAARPRQLFIGADGPRPDREGELEKCEQVRRIATNVDWECEVKTLFRDSNLGCGVAVSEAITWFFQQVEEGIILEDDCLPDPSFFTFCEKQLEMYRSNEQIGIISGNNLISEVWPVVSSDEYIFSAYTLIWGWATTRDNWKLFNYNMAGIDPGKLEKTLGEYFVHTEIVKHWLRIHKIYSENQYNNWDSRFLLNQVYCRKLHVVPQYNLVSNIGFGEGATHTHSNDLLVANLRTYQYNRPLQKKPIVVQNFKLDEILSEYVYGVYIHRSLAHRFFRRLARDLSKVHFKICTFFRSSG